MESLQHKNSSAIQFIHIHWNFAKLMYSIYPFMIHVPIYSLSCVYAGIILQKAPLRSYSSLLILGCECKVLRDKLIGIKYSNKTITS